MRVTGQFSDDGEFHIASLLVHSRPEDLSETATAIAGLEGAEVHGEDAAGKLLVTLEAERESGILSLMTAIQDLDRVLSAVLIYHEVDRSPADEETLQTERHALS